MALRFLQLTLSASPKRLSDAYGGTAGVVDPALDIPYRALSFQAEGADFYVGGPTVSTTNYGAKFLVTGNSAAVATLGPYNSGVLKLSDLYAVGAGATVHITGVPF